MKRKNIYSATIVLFLAFISSFSLQASGKSARTVISNISPNNGDVLFIQVANSGQLMPSPGASNTYKLTLDNVDPFTSYFTDRPKRVTGILPTSQFVSLWHTQDIQTTPPNVALETLDTKNGKRINRVLVLSNPIYDAKKQQINYTAKILDRNAAPLGNVAMGYTVLFIDDFNWGGGKFGS